MLHVNLGKYGILRMIYIEEIGFIYYLIYMPTSIIVLYPMRKYSILRMIYK